jgi:hypothetical protein
MTTLEKSTHSPTHSASASSPAVPQDGSAAFREAYYAYHLGQEVQRHHQRLIDQQAVLYPSPNKAVAAGPCASQRLPQEGRTDSGGAMSTAQTGEEEVVCAPAWSPASKTE